MEEVLAFGISQLNYTEIRKNQKEVVLGYLNGKDVFFCSPTGSGKSLVFEISPFVFSYLHSRDNLPSLTSSVIVISPLVSLMRAQVKKMKSMGLKAVYLSDVMERKDQDQLSMEEIKAGHFDVLVCSPESILGDHRDIIKDLAERKILRAIFVDEAHCIIKFGKPCSTTKRAAFRPAYGRLGEIRSLTGPSVPMIALTATASLETIHLIKKELCLHNCLDVIVSPNKENIKYYVLDIKSDDIRENFNWLIHLLDEHGINTPRMIIFFRKVDHMSVAYKHVVSSLGTKAYTNYKKDGTNDDRNRLIEMFHMKTTEVVKSSICESYEDPAGHTRVVLCTTSFSMGLDVKGVDTVIHYGPANNLEDYLQETGRCGRSLSEKCHAVLLKYKRALASKNISKEMKSYVNEKACRRKRLLENFPVDTDAFSPLPTHLCCDNCTKDCKCACKCINMCSCEMTCDFQSHFVLTYIMKAKDSAFDSSDDSATGFSSESDFEEYLSKRPNVLQLSDESD